MRSSRKVEHRRRVSLLLWLIVWSLSSTSFPIGARAALTETIDRAQPKIVKVYGAGGLRGMEAYQSGVLISPNGHILTVFSHVLDTELITAVLADGRKFEAKLLGGDPRLEIAVLKIDATALPYFDLAEAVKPAAGTRVLALSNVFGVAMGNEPVSAQKGTVAAVTRLEARRGVFETPYRGPVYVLDVTTNNSGAAGGALITWQGQLAGILGKELRNSLNNTWLNYAIPIEELRQSVDAMQAGKFLAVADEQAKKPARSLDLLSLGIVLIPDVVERTPPYVDSVRPDSSAAKAGVRPDDLILLVGDHLVQSCKLLTAELQHVDYEDSVKLTILRGHDVLELSLQSAGDASAEKKGMP